MIPFFFGGESGSIYLLHLVTLFLFQRTLSLIKATVFFLKKLDGLSFLNVSSFREKHPQQVPEFTYRNIFSKWNERLNRISLKFAVPRALDDNSYTS